MKVCSEPGCPNLQRESRCPAHARPNAHRRGYNGAHKALRAAYQRRMSKGERFTCWRCGRPIDPQSWTLGHCDDDRRYYHGPECPPCDYATNGRTHCPHPKHN